LAQCQTLPQGATEKIDVLKAELKERRAFNQGLDFAEHRQDFLDRAQDAQAWLARSM
jgi:hypothetical protein